MHIISISLKYAVEHKKTGPRNTLVSAIIVTINNTFLYFDIFHVCTQGSKNL